MPPVCSIGPDFSADTQDAFELFGQHRRQIGLLKKSGAPRLRLVGTSAGDEGSKTRPPGTHTLQHVLAIHSRELQIGEDAVVPCRIRSNFPARLGCSRRHLPRTPAFQISRRRPRSEGSSSTIRSRIGAVGPGPSAGPATTGKRERSRTEGDTSGDPVGRPLISGAGLDSCSRTS